MKKIVISIFFLSSIFAEGIEEEIQRLEKENQLLKLKQKNKQLTIDLEKGKVTHSKNAIRTKDDTKKKEKNGFFLGVEAELGSFEEKVVDDEDGIKFSHPTTFNGGLLFGYQHYFSENARHGIKISSHLYSGVGYADTDIKKIDDNTTSYSSEQYLANFTQSFIPIKFGLDIKYAGDFLEKQNHLLGLDIGVGYEVDYYKYSVLFKLQQVNGSYNPKQDVSVYFFNALAHGAYFTIGLHYLLKKHHLFEANYRFGGILGLQGKKQIIWNGLPIGAIINTQSYLTLSYAYKF